MKRVQLLADLRLEDERREEKASIKPLTGGKLELLLHRVAEHFPHHCALFLLVARTGMGIGQALAL